MAERKQVNKYYPPDFDPSKHKSINKYRNSHPLRERAKKLSQGILVIRFEMPYNIWCGGCGNHVGMGVRYNAEKKKVGKYYTTPIYRFRMKCHLCDNYIEMETDPKNCEYTIVSGAQRKNQKWDMAENEQVLTEDREAVKKLARDAMYKLEHGVDDTKKLKKVAPTLSQIAEIQSSWKDDYSQNQLLRKKFRGEKKQQLAVEADDKALLVKSSLDIELVPETEEDKKLASLLRFSATETYDEKQKHKRDQIRSRLILTSTISSLPSAETSQQNSSINTATSKHSEAQKSLMSNVLKKRIGGVFGSLKAKGSGAGVKKTLLGGTKGLVVVKKRKRAEMEAADSLGEQSEIIKSDVQTEKFAARNDGVKIECEEDDHTERLSSKESSDVDCVTKSNDVHDDDISEGEGKPGMESSEYDISLCDEDVKGDDSSLTVDTCKQNNFPADSNDERHSTDLTLNKITSVNRTQTQTGDNANGTDTHIEDNVYRTGCSSSYKDQDERTQSKTEPRTSPGTCAFFNLGMHDSEAEDSDTLDKTNAENVGDGKLGQSSLSLVSCYSSSSSSDEDGT